MPVDLSTPREHLMELVRGLWRFGAMKAFIELGCADHLRDGPLTVPELADRCGARRDLLARVLRALEPAGLIQTVTPGAYRLTEVGRLLNTDRPDTLHSAVLANGNQMFAEAILDMAGTVQTGRSRVLERHGGVYGYFRDNPQARHIFQEFMQARAYPLTRALAEDYDFSRIHKFVDVGGGQGHFIAAVLAAHPHVSGVLLDLEQVLPEAQEMLPFGDRCEMVAGDYFTTMPAGGDAYLLSNILHNLDDADALRVLRNIRTAMADDAVVLVAEFMVPEDDSRHPGKDLDVCMLGLFGAGHERTQAEYAALLEKAGFRPGQLLPLDDSVELLEASAT